MIGQMIDSRYAVKLTGQEMYIDAKDKRNINNYANQSCNPNCVLQQWRDKKEKEQVSIVSISEILEGAEGKGACLRMDSAIVQSVSLTVCQRRQKSQKNSK